MYDHVSVGLNEKKGERRVGALRLTLGLETSGVSGREL